MAKILKDEILYVFTELYGSLPFDYQKDVLVCESKRITFCSGRQVGKTTLAAIRAIYHAISDENKQVLIVSPTLRQSGIMFRKIRAACQHELVKTFIKEESQTRIVFKNNSEIHCLPGNNPDTIRGFSPTKAMVDEAAFVKDELFVALEPALSATNGELELYSTPYGKRGRFYDSFRDEHFTKFQVKSSQSPLITQQFLEEQKRSKTSLQYKQEYEGEFIEEADTFFPRQLIIDNIEEIEQEHEVRDGCEYYLGVDCARYGLDETVFILVERDNLSIGRVILIASTSKQPITDIVGRVNYFMKKYPIKDIYIDATGLGGGAADMLKEQGLPIKSWSTSEQTKGDGVQFTLQNKEEMYNNLKVLMEKRLIRYPQHDKLINQLSDLQYKFTSNGHIQIHHPDDANAHDDYPDALALSVLSMRFGRTTEHNIA